jgi:hypothetical protein
LLFVEDGFFDLVLRRKPVLHHGAGAQLAHFDLNETAQVPGGAVLHFEDGIELIVELDYHAGAQLGCRKHQYLSEFVVGKSV